MAIQPPSDLVLDVMQAADPSRAQKVASNLQRLSAQSSAASGVFDTMVAGADNAFAGAAGGLAYASSSVTALHNMTTLARRPGAEQMPGVEASASVGKDNPARKFEAMVLSTFVESMLPSKADHVYGSGYAGGVWRSMLAQKIGDQVAQAGGIGIAKQIATRHPDLAVSGANNAHVQALQSAIATQAAQAAAASAGGGRGADASEPKLPDVAI
ncbi:hypothetical protein GCM10007301_04090 [Azorhizobium oxalatiphilum]|uniref:Flagellar protein FlgJ N-terminal domain-containing protein n=1 Tax=Azorhizobium oxalatiphilum TaxID=980631 RepID=A0A917BJL4_9HYPH|nr:rod-binding protein [Azorhizobium oxalatiphilum]GGF47963.1 hypothetical protein GCM10007301_04090 [Azorhizobium oxalatiphilum]